MKALRDKTFFSATDLCNFNDCTYLTYKSLNELPEEESDEQKMLILRKGIEHEARYLERLSSDGSEITVVCHGEKRHPIEDFQETLRHLKAGKKYIAQGMLTHGRFSGIADLLRRVEVPSKLGEFSYEILDTKLGKKQKVSYLIQLCFYGELLEQVQGVFPKYGYIVDGNFIEHKHALVHSREYFRRLARQFFEAVDTDALEGVSPEPCARCPTCSWSSHCEKKWKEERHLSLVARINGNQRRKLQAAGIRTIDDLARADLTPPKNMHALVFERLREQASLQCSKDQPRYQFIPPSHGGIGFCSLPEGNVGDIFYDIEADPLIKAQALEGEGIVLRDGLEYLHGMCLRGVGNDPPEFRYFLATTKTEERRRYEELIQFFYERMKANPGAHIYHYSGYEIAALKRLNSQYPSQQELLDTLFREERFVDLYAVVRNSIRVSEPKYSIKNLEVFFSKEKRTQEVKGGGDSIVAFEKWLETKDPAILNDIIEYNKKDCISTIELFDWLHHLKEESATELAVDWDAERRKRTQPVSEEQQEERSERIEEERRRIEGYFTHFQIEELLDKDPAMLSSAEMLRLRLFYLADFYRQENKPMWWEFFSLKRDPERRAQNDETLTNCTLVEIRPPEPKKRNRTAVYQAHVASMSEVKMKSGQNLFDLVHDVSLGSLVEILRDERKIVVSIGKDTVPEDQIDLTVMPTDVNRLLQPGIDRFLEKLTSLPLSSFERPSSEIPYAPLIDILSGRGPRMTCSSSENLATGCPLVSVPSSSPDFAPSLLAVTESLAHSYLFIQGPPGTGKTYHGSRLLLQLIKNGARVGVTSNSHKAINNFLEEMENEAHRIGLNFRGVKKVDKENESTWFSSRETGRTSLIANIADTKKIECHDFDLLAGTPWLFVNEKFDQALDYLLVDEASQLSLAHLVAAGISAKNIILIGDPQQLPQPLRGQHQADLDKSPLQILLGDEQVIPPDRGVFLETSRRMHTSICDVLSDFIYDQKLIAPSENAKHAIVNPQPRKVTKASGVLFVPTPHTHNTSSSEEEALVVGELIEELLQCSFQNTSGVLSSVTKRDIIVVSPYNLQVNLLMERIEGVEIGTIDKFQGREAPVAILSMSTSDVNESPRGLDFLFNLNRLNVALSRAKALAIIVASPELLKTRCRKIEQMELVNFFCAIATQ
jgi:predicted RecB family nuclease